MNADSPHKSSLDIRPDKVPCDAAAPSSATTGILGYKEQCLLTGKHCGGWGWMFTNQARTSESLACLLAILPPLSSSHPSAGAAACAMVPSRKRTVGCSSDACRCLPRCSAFICQGERQERSWHFEFATLSTAFQNFWRTFYTLRNNIFDQPATKLRLTEIVSALHRTEAATHKGVESEGTALGPHIIGSTHGAQHP